MRYSETVGRKTAICAVCVDRSHDERHTAMSDHTPEQLADELEYAEQWLLQGMPAGSVTPSAAVLREAAAALRAQADAEPAAYSFEAKHIDSAWGPVLTSKAPVEGPYVRNIRPLYAAHPPAALRQQAEPGELPPLPDPLVMVNRYGASASTADGDGGVFTADQMQAYARLALAQSPLPKERVEKVMALVRNCTAIHRLHVLGHTTDTECSNALAAVRAILEGRQP